MNSELLGKIVELRSDLVKRISDLNSTFNE